MMKLLNSSNIFNNFIYIIVELEYKVTFLEFL